MPLLKHAHKKLRQDKKRTVANKKVKIAYKASIKAAKENPTTESISEAFSSVDKAVKNHLMHANKAARIKSALSKVVPAGAAPKKTTTKKAAPANTEKKTTTKKATVKKATTKKATPKTTKKK
jgi:ribosomal protein S20